MFDRPSIVDEAFTRRVLAGDYPAPISSDLSPSDLADLLDTMMMNRHLDFNARRSKGKTFYSIGSSGHEVMALVAHEARLTDMAFLHYRDAQFCIQRRKSLAGSTPLYDMMLSFTASSEDPVSGGRHKVLGGLDIYTPPQTSTIASHLPKAMGMAHSIGIAKRIGHSGAVPHDSVVLCSFGDASANHSTAQGAINAAGWAAYQGAPMPIVFICEDNDIGISVSTPKGWIEASYQNRPGLIYKGCDDVHPMAARGAIIDAITTARTQRKPVFLHLKTVRLMGHAGADIESAYKSQSEIEANESRDPLIAMAGQVIESGAMSAQDVIAAYETMRARVSRVAQEAYARPKLTTAEQIMEPIIPPKSSHNPPMPKTDSADKSGGKPLTMARQINAALSDLMTRYPQAIIFGEDVGAKGGVYGVTQGLQKQFGRARVFDTLLDEQTILGTAIGAAHNGLLPIPEIQFLAYLHNAEDQIRGEAATLSFFSDGQFTNPMVIRIAGLGYQRGFGGHFHNDNSLAVLRDIPGVIVACPSCGEDASAMLRESMRLAYEERRVVIFVEPIALYHTQDLHEGDGAWTANYSPDATIALGEIGQHGRGKDLAILTYGNGYYLSRRAQDRIKGKSRIIDLRWLQPLSWEAIIKAVKPCANILIVDECRKTGSLSEELITRLGEAGLTMPISRLNGRDSFIPLGAAANTVLLSEQDIVDAANVLCTGLP